MTKSVLSLMVVALTTAGAADQRPDGTGLQITVDGECPIIQRVLNGTSASRAGLMPGDRIVKLDGKSTHNENLGATMRHLAGNAGEYVRVTIRREDDGRRITFDVTLPRQVILPDRKPPTARPVVPTKRAGPVQWNGNRIVSRVLPYADLASLFVRLPVAHAAVTGRGVKVAVIYRTDPGSVSDAVQLAAPEALISTHLAPAHRDSTARLRDKLDSTDCRIAVIPDVHRWSGEMIEQLAKQLLSTNVVVLVPSDLSESKEIVETVNRLHAMGALTVGRVNYQSQVMEMIGGSGKPFNHGIRGIQSDVFSTVGVFPFDQKTTPVATAAGVAALVLEKWPHLEPSEVREKLISGGRSVWQGTSVESGRWLGNVDVHPTTTEYKPRNESAIFRFRVLDAANAVGVDTEIPWFLNMLNCQNAWEVTKGRGVVVVVSDQGFHVKHPELAGMIKAREHFGHVTFQTLQQDFHGTDMSRILLAVAPQAKIIPVLCSAPSKAENIAKSFEFAAEHNADVITASWSPSFAANEKLLSAIRKAADSGTVVSWFYYPERYPGVLRSDFTYSTMNQRPRVGFADRFLTDPPGFHPVEIESGLSGTAPQAAGIAALARSVNPSLTPRQIEKLIFDNSTPIGDGTVLIPDAHRIVVAAKDMASGGR